MASTAGVWDGTVGTREARRAEGGEGMAWRGRFWFAKTWYYLGNRLAAGTQVWVGTEAGKPARDCASPASSKIGLATTWAPSDEIWGKRGEKITGPRRVLSSKQQV